MTAGRARKGWSIRWRLTRDTLAVIALGWLGTVLLTLWFLDHEMSEGFDEEMELVAHTTLLGIESAPAPLVPRVVGMSPEAENERLLRLSRPDAPLPPAPWPQPARDGFSEAEGWRILRLSGDAAIVEVAHSRSWRREELFEAASALLILILPMVLLLVWGITRSLARTLAPVEALAGSIRARGPDDLSPVASADIPRELRPLTDGLNGYLSRIEDLRQAERRFVANAAHELRTPVAAIRARLDLGTDAERAGTLRLLDDLTRRIERLLQLSRSEAGLGLGQGPADLIRILRLLTEETARHAGVTIHLDDGDLESLILPLDPDALAILLRNLIDNAVEHGTGVVRVAVSADARAADALANIRLVIENQTENSAFVDAPFCKGSRSRGIGLGLSIVAALADAMDVPIEKTMADGHARVELTFRKGGSRATAPGPIIGPGT